MEIREVVGASEEVSGWPSELVVENSASELLAPTDFTRRIFAGSPRCDLLTAFPVSPPPPPPPCAIGLGLALRLAARVAAMKLALLGPVAEAAARLFPPAPAGDERYGLLGCCSEPGELRKSARRSLSLSSSSPPPLPRSCAMLDPVVCLLSRPLPFPVVCLAAVFPVDRPLTLPAGDMVLAADVAAESAPLSRKGDVGACWFGLGARLCRCVFLVCCCCCCFCCCGGGGGCFFCFEKAIDAPLSAASCGERTCGLLL